MAEGPLGLHLGPADRAALRGACGEGLLLAARLVTALGSIYGAQDLAPVSSAQIAGVSYRNLGPAGLDFLRDWASRGAKARVPSLLNPAGMDLAAWREHGIPEAFAREQLAVIETYRRLGVTPACTCTPYLVGDLPGAGEHLAWSESSAVAFANSVLGARSNREGGPSALAAAILGSTARYGLHLDSERRATLVVDVACPLRSAADFGALGYLVGCMARDGVPLLRLRHVPDGLAGQEDLIGSPYLPHLKALGAAMAANGAVGLYHIDGVTPEARDRSDLVAPGATRAVIEDLRAGYAALNTGETSVDLVSIGCPHASLGELAELAGLLAGRRARVALWVTMARATLEKARRASLAGALEAAGARLMADTCLVVAPMAAFPFRTVATNSAKMALYAPSHCGLATHYGSLEVCVEAAVSGRWRG